MQLSYCWYKYIFPPRWQILEAKLISRLIVYLKPENNNEIGDENQFWFCQQPTCIMYAH
jgi:hypothetical protein